MLLLSPVQIIPVDWHGILDWLGCELLQGATADAVTMTLTIMTTILVDSNGIYRDENMLKNTKQNDSRDHDNNANAFRLIMS